MGQVKKMKETVMRVLFPSTAFIQTDTGGRQAKDAAVEALAEHKRQGERVDQVVNNLADLRTRNHFAEQIEQLWREKK